MTGPVVGESVGNSVAFASEPFVNVGTGVGTKLGNINCVGDDVGSYVGKAVGT